MHSIGQYKWHYKKLSPRQQGFAAPIRDISNLVILSNNYPEVFFYTQRLFS